MPVLRYFIVVGLVLIGGMFALDAMLPRETKAVVVDEGNDALTNWRAAEARKSSAVRQDDPNSFAVRAPARDAVLLMPAPFAPPPSIADAFAAAISPADVKNVAPLTVVAAAVTEANIPASPAQAAPDQARPVDATPRRQAAKAESGPDARGTRQITLHPPSQDSLRQEAMARAAYLQRTGQAGTPVREANARPSNRGFGPSGL